MSVSWSVAIVTAFLPLAVGLSEADIPRKDEPDARRVERSTHVVKGMVRGVYTAEGPQAPTGADAAISYVIEIRVEKVAKGEGVQVDQLLYVRCRAAKQPATGSEVRQGQNVVPRVRDKGWAYITRSRDGGYDLIEPDGFDVFVATAA